MLVLNVLGRGGGGGGAENQLPTMFTEVNKQETLSPGGRQDCFFWKKIIKIIKKFYQYIMYVYDIYIM